MVEPKVAEPDVPVVFEQPTPDGWEAAFDAAGEVEDEAPEVVPDDDDTFFLDVNASVALDWVKPPIEEWTHWTPKEKSDEG